MKKLQILAAILAMGTMCITGCNMGGNTATDKTEPQTHNIVVREENGNETPAPAPDDNCEHGDNCHRGKTPFKKPGFKFKAPYGRHNGKVREKFRRPHKKPTPVPTPEPEIPAVPEDNTNN